MNLNSTCVWGAVFASLVAVTSCGGESSEDNDGSSGGSAGMGAGGTATGGSSAGGAGAGGSSASGGTGGGVSGAGGVPGTGGSAGGPAPDRELCGHVLCPRGQECCNASCGVCVMPGNFCTEEACAPDCSPMDAEGMGDCRAILGYRWTGSSCASVTGCDCVGTLCDGLYTSETMCMTARMGCLR